MAHFGGAYGERIRVDGVHSGAIVTMGEIHSQIHRGYLFSSWNSAIGVANGSDLDVRIDVPTSAHMRFTIVGGAELLLSFYDSPTPTSAGEELNVFNRNGFSSRTTDVTLASGASFSSLGSLVGSTMIPGGQKNQAAGGIGEFDEMILTSGIYLLRAHNNSGSSTNMSVGIDFYQA